MTITQIKETCLYVADLERTIEFYQGLLELPCFSHVDGRHAFFRAGSSVLLCFIGEVTRKEIRLPSHFATGPQHLAFEVPSSSYQDTLNAYKEKGIHITHEEIWPSGKKSFYFEDPDKHVLEIVEEGLWG